MMIISSTAAGCLYFLGISFWPMFGLVNLIQLIGGNMYYRYIEYKVTSDHELIHNERIKEYSKQGINCVCPDESCSHVSYVPIRFDIENMYECLKCNKPIKVYVGVKTFLLTEPLVEDPFKKFNFVENRDYDS